MFEDLSGDEIDQFFEISATVFWIKEHNFARVALQFPDCLLLHSTYVAQRLEKECNNLVKFYILADTSYRCCCIDAVAAEQAKADCIVHYGDSCLSEVLSDLPIRHVFGKMPIDYTALGDALDSHQEKLYPVCCLLYDALFVNSSGEIYDFISKQCHADVFNCSIISYDNNITSSRKENVCLGRRLPSGSYEHVSVIFIGEAESPLLPLWLMTNLNCQNVLSFSPINSQFSFEKSQATRHLRKRLFLIEKLRDAQTIGIVVNPLDMSGYQEALQRMRKLCHDSGKKTYTLAVGKLNPAKVANFANDIDAFVVLSCPYGILLDTSEYYGPVMSFFEAEVALNANREWNAARGWTSELKKLITGEVKVQAGIADVSLISNKVRLMDVEDHNETSKNNPCREVSVYSTGSNFLKRTWKGLDNSFSENSSTTLQKGRSGIASHYSSEPTES